MKSYLVQVDGTNPKNWREVMGDSESHAVAVAIAPLIAEGHSPELAYVMKGTAKHWNGSPICVQGYRLTIDRKGHSDIISVNKG